MKSLRYILLWAVLTLSAAPLGAQTTAQTAFGKNRVQYHRQFDDWLQYETSRMITYWYGDARPVGETALQMAEYDFAQLQQILEYQPSEKIELLVFTDISDVKQSNIGEDELFRLRAGEAKVIGNKIFVYFDGDHNNLRIQIREGIAGVLINGLLYGSNLQEIVQNAVLLNLPPWYVEGIVGYCGEDWNAKLDDLLRDLLLSGRYKNFDRLAKEHPRLAGQAFWNYIVLHFGKGAINNLLYLTRINRSADAGFLYVLGAGYKRATNGMMQYYQKRYAQEQKTFATPSKNTEVAFKNRKDHRLTQVKISPDGKRIAYALNDIGRWRVWEQDLKTGKRRKVLRGGQRNAIQATDYNYPLLAWSPDNRRLSVIYERRDVVMLAHIETDNYKKTRRPLAPEYQRVYSIDYASVNDLIFSAAVRGYSDLFLYRLLTNQSERLTHDFWDDLDASYAVLEGKKGVLFSSNRLNDTLSTAKFDTIMPLGAFDLFWYDLETRSPELIRLTHTPWANERQAVWADSAHFVYLSDESGVVNIKSGRLEPFVAFNTQVIYLKDGAEVTTLDMNNPGEWPVEKALRLYAPLDSVLPNIDTLQIDSIVGRPFLKKKSKLWNLSNYDRNTLALHFASRTGKGVWAMRRGNKDRLHTSAWHTEANVSPTLTRYKSLFYRALQISPERLSHFEPEKSVQAPPPAAQLPLPESTHNAKDTIPPGWMFRMPARWKEDSAPVPYPAPPLPAPLLSLTRADADHAETELNPLTESQYLIRPTLSISDFEPKRSPIAFNSLKIIPYRLRFRTDYFTTSVDNNLLFEGLESFAGSPAPFRTPPPGLLIKANFKDVLENHALEAGFRLPTTFNGMEYYLWYDNKKRRIDRRIALYRRTTVQNVDQTSPGFALPNQARVNTLLGQYELRYPFDPFLSLRATGTLRQDRTIRLSGNRNSLEVPDYAEQRAALRLTLVYDNAVDIDLNIKSGTKVRLFAEAVKRFALNTEPAWTLRFNEGFMTVMGIDARHYILLDKRSILAMRLAGGATFGSERILYFLGGVDNWLIPQFNNSIPVPDNPDFAYRTLAANLRGFRQNIRNGSNFALLNTELRVPIFKYLMSNKPVLGNFWRNFQLTSFFDVGSAWQPARYVGDINPLNTRIFTNPPTVVMRVNYFRDPLVAGYGVGLRSMVFGMYMRLDYAWGIETRVIQKPMLHLALGADF